MFEMFKRAASATWSAVKYVAAPVLAYIAAPITITARAVSSAGQVVFTIRKIVGSITGTADHTATLPLVGTAVFVNLLTFFPTRAPLLWRFFRLAKKDAPVLPPGLIQEDENETEDRPPLNVVVDTEHEEIIVNLPPQIAEELRPLGKTGKLLYLMGLVLAWSSTGFITLNSYLFNVSFLNFAFKVLGDHLIDELKTESADEPDWDDNIKIGVQVLAGSLVLANLISNLTWNQLKNKQAARKFAEHIENWDLPLDRYTAGAVLISSPAILAAFFVGLFSTENSLAKIPYIMLPSIAKKTISIYSGSTALVYNAMTSLPAVRSAFMRKKNNYSGPLPCWEKPLKIMVRIVGFFDTGTTAAGTFTSFTHTMGDVTNTDSKHLVIIAGGVAVSISAFLNNYKYSVIDPMDYVFELYHHDRGDFVAYESVPQIDIDPSDPSSSQQEPTQAMTIGASRFGVFSEVKTRSKSVDTRSSSIDSRLEHALAFGSY